MRWSINGISILGPDIVEYRSGETTILLNGVPRKHAHRSIVLSYRNLHASMLASLWQAIYDAARENRTVLLSYYDQDGVWRISPARPRIPTIGSLRGVEGVDIVLTFFLDPNIDVAFVGLPPAPAPSIGEQSLPDLRRFLVNQMPMVGALLALQAGTPSVSSILAPRDVVGVSLIVATGTPSVSDAVTNRDVVGVSLIVATGTPSVSDAVTNRDIVGVSLNLSSGTPMLISIFPPSPAGAVLELLAGTPVVDSVALFFDGVLIVVESGITSLDEPIMEPIIHLDGATLELLVSAFDIQDQQETIDLIDDGATLELLVSAFDIQDQQETIDLIDDVLELNAGTSFVEGNIDIEWGDVIVDFLAGTLEMSDE